MDTAMDQSAIYDAQRARANQEELKARIMSVLPEDGAIEPLPGFRLVRRSTPSEKLHGVLKPSLCVVAQGKKVVYVGDNQYQYDPFNYLLATMELPRVSQVLVASDAEPYLGFVLELSPTLVSSVMIEAGHIQPQAQANARAIDVSTLDTELLDAIVRLTRLAGSPAEARVLMPLVKREIIYRLLTGALGSRLCHLTEAAAYTSNIARAVERFRHDFDQNIRVEDVAQELGMSVSSFHHHFKAVTALSPMQFQKRLRLQEARRLMLGEDLDATSTAYRVGYNDAAHFSREYKSLFGAPPIRDVERLRAVTGAHLVLKAD